MTLQVLAKQVLAKQEAGIRDYWTHLASECANKVPLLRGNLAILDWKLDYHAITVKQMLHALEGAWPVSDIIPMQPWRYGAADLQRQPLYLQKAVEQLTASLEPLLTMHFMLKNSHLIKLQILFVDSI